MASVVILGAGELGGALARQLAVKDIVGTVILIDEAGNVAHGKALDIRQAAPVDRYTTTVVGTDDLSATIGAAVMVIADRAGTPAGEWRDDAGVALVRRVVGLNNGAPIVCAGAQQISIIERSVRELGVPRTRVVGSASEGLRAAVVSMTALEARCAPGDVSLTVVGRPPQQIIVPWNDAAIAGRCATGLLSPPAITRLDARLPRLWPPGPLTLASAATRTIHAALTRSPHALTLIVALAREQGSAGRAAMLPVTVTPAGVDHVESPRLSTRDQVRLETVLYS